MALKVQNIKKDLTNYGKFVGKTALNMLSPSTYLAGSILSTAANSKPGQKAISTAKKTITNRYGTIDTGGSNTTKTAKTTSDYSMTPYSSESGGGSSSGGTSIASLTPSITAQDVYDEEKEIYERQYNEAKNRAQQSYERDLLDLKTVLDRATDTYNTQKEDYNKLYDTQASNLAKSIERFREQNKENVASQRKAYLSNQAALEAAREQADRQNRISAAARGLGGSGLQQLAQLQNLITQGQEISDLATENQSNMNTLRLALAQAEEDYNDKLTQSEDARSRALRDIGTTLKNAQEDYETNKEKAKANLDELLEKYETGRASSDVSALNNLYNRISASSGGSGSSGGSDLGPTLDFLTQQLQSNLDAIDSMTDSELDNTYGTKNKSSIYNNLLNQARLEAVNSGVNSQNYNTLNNNLTTLIAAKKEKDEKNKKPTLMQRLFG